MFGFLLEHHNPAKRRYFLDCLYNKDWYRTNKHTCINLTNRLCFDTWQNVVLFWASVRSSIAWQNLVVEIISMHTYRTELIMGIFFENKQKCTLTLNRACIFEGRKTIWNNLRKKGGVQSRFVVIGKSTGTFVSGSLII